MFRISRIIRAVLGRYSFQVAYLGEIPIDQLSRAVGLDLDGLGFHTRLGDTGREIRGMRITAKLGEFPVFPELVEHPGSIWPKCICANCPGRLGGWIGS